MARPDERRFITFRRGHVRDNIILSRFRIALRSRINPDTGQIFTEDEIAIITQPDSRFYTEADGIDLYGQAVQARALWLSDQLRPKRAATPFLEGYHGPLWTPDGKLSATGGSGEVTATGSPGTVYVGSTTIGDPTAQRARDPNGKRYQVLITAVAGATGSVGVQMQGIDTGTDTNPVTDTVMTWINPPIGSDAQASVAANFAGGFPAETDAEHADRIEDRIQFRPGSGNSAQTRAWARQASNAVQTAFVYCTALHAGSQVVCILQKRGSATGPLARIPSVGTLATVTGYLVPPASPVVPHGKHVLVVPPVSEPSDMVLRLGMRRGSAAGWADVTPWPEYSVAYNTGVRVTSIAGMPSYFDLDTDIDLEGAPLSGVDAPQLMVWDDQLSRFELLDVQQVAAVSGDTWRVTLSTAPVMAGGLAVGDMICPANNRALVLAQAVEAYYDELGPGELVDATDIRFARAARFPRPDIQYPIRVSQTVIARIDDQLGGAVSDSESAYISVTTPTLATQPVDGPNLLTLGQLGLYAV